MATAPKTCHQRQTSSTGGTDQWLLTRYWNINKHNCLPSSTSLCVWWTYYLACKSRCHSDMLHFHFSDWVIRPDGRGNTAEALCYCHGCWIKQDQTIRSLGSHTLCKRAFKAADSTGELPGTVVIYYRNPPAQWTDLNPTAALWAFLLLQLIKWDTISPLH